MIRTIETELTNANPVEALSPNAVAEQVSPVLLHRISEIFGRGTSEFFEDGMHSSFSRELVAFLEAHGVAGVSAVEECILAGDAAPDVVSEALRWFAEIDDPATLPHRWRILERALSDRSPRVRDGAILGFAALNDPRARGLLIAAMDRESVPELER